MFAVGAANRFGRITKNAGFVLRAVREHELGKLHESGAQLGGALKLVRSIQKLPADTRLHVRPGTRQVNLHG